MILAATAGPRFARGVVHTGRRVALATTVVFALAPFAIGSARAQTDATTQTPPKKPAKKKPKKGAKPAPAESAPPVETAAPPPPPVDTTPPPPPPAPEPTPAPPPAAAAAPEASPNDPTEDPTKSYNFVGLRYRATVLPSFMLHLFADGGQTIVTNTIGVEFDHHRDNFSMIPWLVYTSYGTGNMLFLEKGQPEQPQYLSEVNSSLKSIYAGVDLLWAIPLGVKGLSFELGAGFGVGFIFGSLLDNWVYANPNGPLVGASGTHYSPCQTGDTEVGCNSVDHKNATILKTGGYIEPNWFHGGSVPVFFPHIALPDVGLRYKPVKQVEMRINTGFSLTGFFFGISGDYGIPDAKESATPPAAGDPPAKSD